MKVSLGKKIKNEYAGKVTVTIFGLFIIILTLLISVFLIQKGIILFTTHGHSIKEFLFTKDWFPADVAGAPEKGQVGASIFIYGSILISTIALLIATPFSIASAIFMNEISPKLGKRLLQPAIEIFVGIPSVVYGWLGLTLLVPFIDKVFHTPVGGLSVLSGAVVLALMIFPTITSVATDAIRTVPIENKEASYALGSTRWQMIYKVQLKAATPGILTGIVLGLARAFGEALAVAMVIGKSYSFPKNLLYPTLNLTSIISMDMGYTAQGSEANDGLWTMALLLFIISLVFIIVIRTLGKRGNVIR